MVDYDPKPEEGYWPGPGPSVAEMRALKLRAETAEARVRDLETVVRTLNEAMSEGLKR